MADNWEAVSGYDTNDYTDAMIIEMDAGSKRFREISGQALVAGEKNSQYIRFMIPRYWDGIDVSEMNISIVYGLAGKYYGESDAVSVERTDDRLRFGWVVPEEACCIAGTLLFEIIIKNDAYTLKSQIVETIVFKSINIDDIAPEPTREAWYKEFQARVDQALTSAEDILSEAQDVVAEARAYVGAPLVARTADDFEDTDRIYVYTGSEEGYNTGHWYYWRGTAMAWTDGGVYNAAAVDTDTTLSIAGKAADAKEVGDQLTSVKEDLSDLQNGGYVADAQKIQEKIDNYLDEHPEATTTVEDGAITEAKLNSEVTEKLLSDYYYPEITSWQERLHDTTCYFVSVPVRDTDNNVINPYLKYEADLTPLDHAIANHTTFTCNGTTGCLQNGSIVRGHVISRGRSVYNNTLTSVANSFRYVSINADRTVTDYAVNNTTQDDMLGNGAYNVFCAYYKLIDNGTIVDNSATVNNESKNVTTLYVPYTAIGVMSDNTLLFMAADGGTDIDKGLNSVNAANILLDKGCVNAWAMDGGGSVSFNVRGAKYNRNIDNDGTTDRLVHISLNFKKDSKTDSVTEAFGKIGEEKQNVVKQIIPYINDLYDKHESLINNEGIASGTDLNTITAIGRYAATTTAVATSLTNSPTAVAFMMEVIKISSAMSFYVILDYNSDIYVRRNYVYSNANHFSAWKKVTTE